MSTHENQPVFENEAARAAFFQARVDAIKQAKIEGDAASAEFLAKEAELHARTERLIALHPSELNPLEESQILPIYSYADESRYSVVKIVPAVRLIQKKRIGQKGNETIHHKSTIEYLQLEEGKLPKHIAYVHGFDNKVYQYATRPGVGARKSIEAANGYEIQELYAKELAAVENLLIPHHEDTAQ